MTQKYKTRHFYTNIFWFLGLKPDKSIYECYRGRDKACLVSTWVHGTILPLFFKNKIHRQNQQGKANNVIQTKSFSFENQQRKHRKYHQGNHFLNHL